MEVLISYNREMRLLYNITHITVFTVHTNLLAYVISVTVRNTLFLLTLLFYPQKKAYSTGGGGGGDKANFYPLQLLRLQNWY